MYVGAYCVIVTCVDVVVACVCCFHVGCYMYCFATAIRTVGIDCAVYDVVVCYVDVDVVGVVVAYAMLNVVVSCVAVVGVVVVHAMGYCD